MCCIINHAMAEPRCHVVEFYIRFCVYIRLHIPSLFQVTMKMRTRGWKCPPFWWHCWCRWKMKVGRARLFATISSIYSATSTRFALAFAATLCVHFPKSWLLSIIAVSACSLYEFCRFQHPPFPQFLFFSDSLSRSRFFFLHLSWYSSASHKCIYVYMFSRWSTCDHANMHW